MQKEHKRRQRLFHERNKVRDYHQGTHMMVADNDPLLVELIVWHFEEPVPGLVYPAKAFVVAIIYAKLLEIYFNELFHDSLNDPTLLYNNDRFFVPYSQAPGVYDAVLQRISLDFNTKLPQIQATINYFLEEFLITDTTH